MDQTNVYQSINKFITFIKEHYPEHNFESAQIYFDGDEVFKNQFNNTCIKSIFIQLNGEEKVYLSHKKILETFGGQLIVSFNENSKRKLSKTKGTLFKLIIEFEQKEFGGNKFYPSVIVTCNNKRNIELIRRQIETQTYVEEVIPIDAFT